MRIQGDSWFRQRPKRSATILVARLGDWFVTRRGTLARLVRVTGKGFNLLDDVTGQCILSRHLYDDRFSGISESIPDDLGELRLRAPEWLSIGLVPAESLNIV